MGNVICISAGQLITKKHNNRINRRNQYLNYGLLSLASVLKRHQLAPIVIHGHFDTPEETLAIAIKHGLETTPYPVLLSIPSYYAVSWANRFITLTKEILPNLQIVVGGRWVIANRPDLLQALVPGADQIVRGLAENSVVKIVTGETAITPFWQPGNHADAEKASSLDYSLLHQRHLYQPSIEIARGCGMRCTFCQEKDEKLQPLKPPKQLVAELGSTLLNDSLVEMTPYFETSMFVPNPKWIGGLRAALDQAEMQISWRTEARVDTIKPELVPALAASGLSIIDVGLESASPTQLRRMHKTRDPKRYLERASALLRTCAENGIRVKVNILLFAGENSDTIQETLHWLEAHRDSIYGVSVSPVIAFGWPEDTDAYLGSLAEWGATRSHSPCAGVTHLNLSDDLNYEDSLTIARFMSRQFMRASQYFTLKSFSYFPRDYSFESFLSDIGHEPGSHSFSTAFLEECIQEVMGMAA